jgi:serine/threonine protein kinase/Tfp pilus assembly protein PilF
MDIDQLAGTILGNYKVESLLGRGGMGVVYKAHQISLDRPVALKILPPTLSSDSSFVKRFKREARAVAKLSHSNIIQIFDITEGQNLHFFSMEYVEGRTLDKVLEEKDKLEPSEAVNIISQAALALEHAHKNDIIHRDIKPSNIILDRRGNVKVMDFGLARIADDRSRLTQSGTLMGTLDYMSPEQCRGEELDERTDIYSLGVLLYEMLTGKTPFEAPNEAALIHKIINEKPCEVRSIESGVPIDLSDIVSRAMLKNKDDRYSDISEFLDDVRSFTKLTPAVSVEEAKSTPSIAVLPFVNMSADPEQEYFCDGLSEELINALTQIRDLKVIARTSAFSFRGKEVDVRDIGKKLDVSNVLEGSVRKAGKKLRITAQLVDTESGHHLWSERYDRELEDVFAIQDEITKAIVDKLKPRLLDREKARVRKRQTVNLEAYNIYLEGRYFWNKMNEDALKKAIECFEIAIAKDPNYALAYAGLADAQIGLTYYSTIHPKKLFPKAKKAAMKALAIDNSLAEAHTPLAVIKTNFDWDWEGAEKEYKRAIELNPGYAVAHMWYANYLNSLSRFDEAVKEIELALELDPVSPYINRQAGGIYAYIGKYGRAIEVTRKTLELDPKFHRAHLQLGVIYFLKSMYKEARAEFERELEISRPITPYVESHIGSAYALMGEQSKTEDILKSLLEQSRKTYVAPSTVAFLYLALGDFDKGFEWLNKAYEEHDIWLGGIRLGAPFLNIETDPRYTAILRKINLEP